MNRDAEIERAARAMIVLEFGEDARIDEWMERSNFSVAYRRLATAAITPLLDRIETLEPVWAMTTPTDKLVARVTPEFAAMNGRDKWETLVLAGLIGTDEPYIAALTQTLRAEAAALVAAEDEIGRLREPLAILASIWMHGDWLAETPNERLLEQHMTRLGFWPDAAQPKEGL